MMAEFNGKRPPAPVRKRRPTDEDKATRQRRAMFANRLHEQMVNSGKIVGD